MMQLTTLALALTMPMVGAEAVAMVKIDYEVHTGHFESNKSGLKGDASYLAFADKAAFDMVFGVAFTMGKKPNVEPKDAFEKKIVVAVIKRGDAPFKYQVMQVTEAGGTLYVEYTAKADGAATASARFASPLIVSVEKGKYTNMVFIENGKKAGSAAIGK